jgi:hypothetical protein
MDKLTPAKALDLLHTPLSAVERCQVAALIEALEADAAAMREAIDKAANDIATNQMNYDGDICPAEYLECPRGWVDKCPLEKEGRTIDMGDICECWKLRWGAATTAGAALLVVVRAAERLNRAVKLYLKHSNSPVAIGWDEMLDALTEFDKAVAAYRGGVRK